MTGTLVQISGVWITDPDTESWNPTYNSEWTEGSGRVVSGKFVGSRRYFKYSLPLKWVHLPEADFKKIAELIEDGTDYISVKFYHRCGYITRTFYAGVLSPSGIEKADGKIYYKDVSVTLVEQ